MGSNNKGACNEEDKLSMILKGVLTELDKEQGRDEVGSVLA
jgi:hypothetical protein